MNRLTLVLMVAALGVILVGCGGQTVGLGSEVAVSPDASADTSSANPTPVDSDDRSVAPASDGAENGAAHGAMPTIGSSGPALVLHADASTVIEARSEARADAPVVARLESRLDTTQAFLATMSFDEWKSRSSDPEWIEVLLPVRPNGQTGWIPVDQVTPYRNGYRVEIDVDDFRLQVFKDGAAITDTTIALGAGDTPTPLGQFYLTELIQANEPNGVYGPYAFGLSGYSETLDTFGTGEGVIGIHGTNQPESLGASVSHGCIRVANDQIEMLAAILPLGTPVEIRAGGTG